MNQRGSALLSALWLSALLAGITATILAGARQGSDLSGNRVALVQAAWAAEGCLAVAQARYAASTPPSGAEQRFRGNGAWCSVAIVHPSAKLNLNVASPDALSIVLGRADLVDALRDWQDADSVPREFGGELAWYRAARRRTPRNGALASVEELRYIRGFEDSVLARVLPLVTVEGNGRVNLNEAPESVLRALPGIDARLARTIVERRTAGAMWSGLDEWYHSLDASLRGSIAPHYQDLSASVVVTDDRIGLTIAAGVGRLSVTYRMDVVAAIGAPRLAVVGRRVRQ